MHVLPVVYVARGYSFSRVIITFTKIGVRAWDGFFRWILRGLAMMVGVFSIRIAVKALLFQNTDFFHGLVSRLRRPAHRPGVPFHSICGYHSRRLPKSGSTVCHVIRSMRPYRVVRSMIFGCVSRIFIPRAERRCSGAGVILRNRQLDECRSPSRSDGGRGVREG